MSALKTGLMSIWRYIYIPNIQNCPLYHWVSAVEEYVSTKQSSTVVVFKSYPYSRCCHRYIVYHYSHVHVHVSVNS